jgi:4'-phosphopantetheinyl transferase EntD
MRTCSASCFSAASMRSDRMPEALLSQLALPGIEIGVREIAAGDERFLLPGEAPIFARAALAVKQRSGSARELARELLARLGGPSAPLVRDKGQGPRWPAGYTGSLAHDDTHAAAAVARARDFSALGIDIEPGLPLPADVAHLVATETESARHGAEVLRSRVLFAVKEAVYKAVHPLDGIFLDFPDVEVDLAAGIARTSYGRTVPLRVATGPHIVALAYLAG